MSIVKVFGNGFFNLGVKKDGDEILFNAEDVAKALGFTTVATTGNVYVRWNRVNEFLPQVAKIKKGDFISESMLYKLAFKASNETAEKFTDWVAVEVLPQIRKTGGYSAKLPTTYKEALLQLVEQVETNEKLEQRALVAEQVNLELQPKATYYDLVLQNKSTLTATQIAKDYGMSANTFNKKLHSLGIQYKQGKQWFLYAKYQDKGYTQSHTWVDDTETARLSTRWTQKGRLFLYEELKKIGFLPLIELSQLEEA